MLKLFLCSNTHIKFGLTICNPIASVYDQIIASVRGQIGRGAGVKRKREEKWEGEKAIMITVT
jgi:hypothetical protein